MPERPQYLIDADSTHDILPDEDDVYGHEGNDVSLLVRHDGPVRTEELPKHLGSALTYPSVGGAQRILFGDPRRSRAVIMAIDTDIIIGATQNETDTSYGVYWPKLVALTLTHQDEVWVKTTGAATRVSVINEQWSK